MSVNVAVATPFSKLDGVIANIERLRVELEELNDKNRKMNGERNAKMRGQRGGIRGAMSATTTADRRQDDEIGRIRIRYRQVFAEREKLKSLRDELKQGADTA